MTSVRRTLVAAVAAASAAAWVPAARAQSGPVDSALDRILELLRRPPALAVPVETPTPSPTPSPAPTPSPEPPPGDTAPSEGGDPADAPAPRPAADRDPRDAADDRAAPDRAAGERAASRARRAAERVVPPDPPSTALAADRMPPLFTPGTGAPATIAPGIPQFLFPIYEAAADAYGVPWAVLAAINEIETAFGRNLNVSSAGAIGWMQFMPGTWAAYGVDANGDGRRDPYDPVDAIFAAARYLRAAGAATDLRRAVFAYNHAGWYVEWVLGRAAALGALVSGAGAFADGFFPVAGHARTRRAGGGAVRIASRRSAPVIAAADGEVVRIGSSRRRGRFLVLRDATGNTYTYARLAAVARLHVAPAPTTGRPADRELPAAKRRLYARPLRARPLRSGGDRQVLASDASVAGFASVRARVQRRYGVRLRERDVRLRRLRVGSRVAAGAVIGRSSGELRFAIEPAGDQRVDALAVLEGWRLLDAVAVPQPAGTLDSAAPADMLALALPELSAAVLLDPAIDIYACGRRDVRRGLVDQRVLTTLWMLSGAGLRPTVSSLRCGHGRYTASGNVSHHSVGRAMDIAMLSGTPVLGHQGPHTLAEAALQRLAALSGPLRPEEIISLMTVAGAGNTLAMSDHADHLHVGWGPAPAMPAVSLPPPTRWAAVIEQRAYEPVPAAPATR